ncbi:unnamed protein product, partial [Arabidopsis halleri]
MEVPDSYHFPSGTHVASSVTLKLNDRNYLMWKTQFESLLSSQKLLGFFNGRQLRPHVTIEVRNGNVAEIVPNPKYEDWFCTDQLVRSWLLGTLSEEVLGYVFHIPTAHEIWMSLAEHFNKSSQARVFELKRTLQGITQIGKSFTEYCKEFRTVCDEVSSIGQPVEESMKIFTFLNGLEREYDPIVTVRLRSRDKVSGVNVEMAFQAQQAAFFSSGSNNRGGRGGRGGPSRGGRGGYSSRGPGFHQQVSQSSNSSKRHVCQICEKTGHVALKCWSRFDNSYQSEDLPQALAALHLSDSSGQEWFPSSVIDSGATAHITQSPASLHNTTPYNGSDSVIVGNGDHLPITHVGSTVIQSSSGVHSGLGNSEIAHPRTSNKAPMFYWVEAFYTANYIINLLPSSALQNNIPYELLFNKKPEYTALRVFGSACYPSSSGLAVCIPHHQYSSRSTFTEDQEITTEAQISPNSAVTTNVHPMITRGKAGVHKPNPRYVLLATTHVPPEPKIVVAALQDDKWTTAMEEEIDSFHVTKTFRNGSQFLQEFIDQLSIEFSMKDLGCLHYFLGIQVQHHPNCLFLSQAKYAEDILHQASLFDCKPMPTPLPSKIYT